MCTSSILAPFIFITFKLRVYQYFVPLHIKCVAWLHPSPSVTDVRTQTVCLVNAQMRFCFSYFWPCVRRDCECASKPNGEISFPLFCMNIGAKGDYAVMEHVWILSEELTYVIKFRILVLIFFSKICLKTSFNVFGLLQSNMVLSPFLFPFPFWLFFRVLAVLKFCFTSTDACLVIFFFQFASSSCAVVCVHADIFHSCFIALVSMPKAMHHSHSDPIPPPCPLCTYQS